MVVARLESPPPPTGGGSPALGLTRNRPERELLALSRGGVLSPQQVKAVQRGFLLEAMTEAAAELGYARTSANEVIRRAKISRLTFYELFKNVDECFLAALEAAHERVLHAARAGCAQAREESWSAQARAGVIEVLSLLDAQPVLAQLCVVQALSGPRAALQAHQALVAELSSSLVSGLQATGPRRVVPERVVQMQVAGAWMLVHSRLVQRPTDRAPLVSLTGEIMFAICALFQGEAAATRQLHLPLAGPARDWGGPAVLTPGEARQQVERSGGGSRKQVLRYLAQHGGASNQLVAEHLHATASTTSRRLAGLAKDRLIISTKRGGRHSWHVTERGLAILADEEDVAALGRHGRTR